MSKYKYGYKAVECFRNVNREMKLRSAANIIPTWARMLYEEGKYTLRKDGFGPLAVFTTKRNVRYFIPQHSIDLKQIKVFRCMFKESDDNIMWFTRNGGPEYPKMPIPTGTKFADKVKLLHEVDIYKGVKS